MSFGYSLFFIFLIPIIGAILIPVFRKNINQRETVSFLTAISLFLVVINLFLNESGARDIINLISISIKIIIFYPQITYSDNF